MYPFKLSAICLRPAFSARVGLLDKRSLRLLWVSSRSFEACKNWFYLSLKARALLSEISLDLSISVLACLTRFPIANLSSRIVKSINSWSVVQFPPRFWSFAIACCVYFPRLAVKSVLGTSKPLLGILRLLLV